MPLIRNTAFARWTVPALCVAIVAIAACKDSALAQSKPRAPEQIYAKTCGYCHGHNVGPIIRGRQLPAEAVVLMVRNGRGAMPAFRPTEITDAELKALADWVSSSRADPKEHGQ